MLNYHYNWLYQIIDSAICTMTRKSVESMTMKREHKNHHEKSMKDGLSPVLH